jgi:hypothetical protein
MLSGCGGGFWMYSLVEREVFAQTYIVLAHW